MSLALLEIAFRAEIFGARKAVLVALAEHADDAGNCFPSIERIAVWAGLQERGARLALRQLEADGLIVTMTRFRQTSQYRLAIQAIASLGHPKYPAPRAPLPNGQRGHDMPHEGASRAPRRGHSVPNEGAPHAPEPSLNRQEEPSLNRHGGTRAKGGGLFPEHDEPDPPPAAPRQKTKPAVARLSAIDPNWWPDAAGIAFAQERGIVALADEVERFRSHHAGRGSRMASWPAAWRTWCMNSQRFAQRDRQRQHQVPSHAGRGGRRSWIAEELGLADQQQPDEFTGVTIDGETT